MRNKSLILISIVVLIATFIGGVFVYKNSQTQKSVNLAKEQAELFQRPYSYVVGNKDAKVQLVEFFDPACETCAAFHPHIKDLIEKYDGQVKLVLRYAPFHTNANYAVKILEGAKEQGQFEEVLDFMFITQRLWTQHHEVKPELLWAVVSKMKALNLEKLQTYVNSSKTDAIIKQDLEDAATLGVTKTPGYIVNGKPLQEFGFENLVKLIESEL